MSLKRHFVHCCIEKYLCNVFYQHQFVHHLGAKPCSKYCLHSLDCLYYFLSGLERMVLIHARTHAYIHTHARAQRIHITQSEVNYNNRYLFNIPRYVVNPQELLKSLLHSTYILCIVINLFILITKKT